MENLYKYNKAWEKIYKGSSQIISVDLKNDTIANGKKPINIQGMKFNRYINCSIPDLSYTHTHTYTHKAVAGRACMQMHIQS